MEEWIGLEKLCVVGLGYIGLPTASLLATKGFQVHGVDTDPSVVETINQGLIHIHEPALDVIVKAAVNSGRLAAALEPEPADVFILAVPTPIRPDKSPELDYVLRAAEMVAPHVRPGSLVILESTSPVCTTETVAGVLAARRPDLRLASRDNPAGPTGFGAEQVYVAHCPERVLPGQILRELVENDRIVGGVDRPSTERAVAFYRSFVAGNILATDSRTAELAKLTENSFRDVNIAFANELSLVCERLAIDVWELVSLANHHPRVNILKPGPGVGGHCIAVDPWFIVDSVPDLTRLIRTAREVNDGKPHHVVAAVRRKAERFRDPVIACLGLAFKADVDDLRESPAVEIVAALAEEAVGRLLVVEPHVRELPPALRAQGVSLTDLVTALGEADIVVVLVDHTAFGYVDRSAIQDKVVIDTRGLWR